VAPGFRIWKGDGQGGKWTSGQCGKLETRRNGPSVRLKIPIVCRLSERRASANYMNLLSPPSSLLPASAATPSPSSHGHRRSPSHAPRRPPLARTRQRLQRRDQRKSRLERLPLVPRPRRPLRPPAPRPARRARRHPHPPGERTLSDSRRRRHQCPQAHKGFLEEGQETPGLRCPGGPGSHRAQ
jgi:hypothetical protein